MPGAVISVSHLSKRYVIGHQRNRHDGLRHWIEDAARAPWRWLKAKAEGRRAQSKEHGVLPGSALSAPGSLHPASTREEFWALKDVSFEVKQGEVVGIIGRNGAGKSTLLKILSRITEPTEGSVRIKGRVASLLEVGTGFHPELTGRENIYLNGAILGMSKVEIKAKFDEIVAFSEIERFLDTPVKRYSSGMYVRLAFAVAAHLEPDILVVDEVLAVGDAQFQNKCLGKMGEVSRGGRTVLFVSHNLAAVSTLTTRCLYLEGGQTRFIGDTTEATKLYMESGQSDKLVYSDNEAANGSRPMICHVKVKTSLPGNVHIINNPLAIEIALHTPRAIHGACVSVQVFDSEQVNYAHVWAHNLDLPMCRQPGTHLLICRIPKFRLYMGRYRLRVYFSEPPGGESFQVLDGVCPFEIIMRDNSRLFKWWPKECAYLEECQWETCLLETEN